MIRQYILTLKNNKKVKVTGFYISAITKKFNIDEKTALRECNKLVDEEILKIKHEIRCPKCFWILKNMEFVDTTKEFAICPYCDEEFNIKDNTDIMFEII